MAETSHRLPPKRPPITVGALWHSTGFRSLVYQFLVVVLVVATFIYLFSNAQRAMESRGIATGFGFLSEEAGFAIGESVISFAAENTYLRAFGVAILNTFKVAIVSLVFATTIGTLLGIARLSSNWLLSKLASIYVEVFRNTPQLVQIIFWYTLITRLPGPRQAFNPIEGVYLCNRGLFMGWPMPDPIHPWMVVSLILGCLSAYGLSRWSQLRLRRTGYYVSVFWYGLLIHRLLHSGNRSLRHSVRGTGTDRGGPCHRASVEIHLPLGDFSPGTPRHRAAGRRPVHQSV